MSEFAIHLKQAVVCIDGQPIIDAIDLTVVAGERIAIVGHNGAGKSTLLKLLTGMQQPSHGSVEVLGLPLHAGVPAKALRQLRARTGQVFQGLHLVQRLSVLENVLAGSLAVNRSLLTWARIFPRVEVMRAEQALEAVGLIGKAQLRADRLSGGERQKTAIARMLMQRPQLILADEPTASLDPVASLEIAQLLLQVARQTGSTLVSVVHDPGLLSVLAERVIGLRDGKLLFDLPVAQVDDALLARLYRQDSSGWVSRLRQRGASLEAGVVA